MSFTNAVVVPPGMATVEQVAALTGRSESVLRLYLEHGRLPGERVGRRWLMRHEDALALAEEIERRGERRGVGPRQRVATGRKLLGLIHDRPGISTPELVAPMGLSRRQTQEQLRFLELRGLVRRGVGGPEVAGPPAGRLGLTTVGPPPARFGLTTAGEEELGREPEASTLRSPWRVGPAALDGEGVRRAG